MQIRDEYCSFNRIYKLDGKFGVGERKIVDIRKDLSEALAQHIMSLGLSYDAVSPVPNTGGLYSNCIAEQLNIPEYNIFKKELAKKTLGKDVFAREAYYYKNLKYIASDVVLNKSILFIDEALLSGLTVQLIAKACKENGIDNYSFAFMSPVNHLSCPFGHITNTSRVISNVHFDNHAEQIETFRKQIGAQEITFFPYNTFAERVGGDSVCKLCFRNCGVEY